jgi:hypothetical protein
MKPHRFRREAGNKKAGKKPVKIAFTELEDETNAKQ